MNKFFNSKIKHFSILDKEWSKLEKKIKNNKKILIKKNCPICKKNNFKLLFQKKGLNFVKCKCKSEHVYINPAIKEKYLFEHFKNSLSWKIWSKNVLKSKKKNIDDIKKYNFTKIFLKNKLKKNFKLLDVGCSSGNFLEFSKKNLTKNCYGLEPSIEAYKIAIKNNQNIINTNFENYKINEKFDLISFWASFEYCSNLENVIKKIKKLLKKNGILLIYISGNSSSFIMRMLKKKCVGFVFNRSHYFSPNSLNMLFKKHNFKKIFQKSFISEIDVISNYLNYNQEYSKQISNNLKKKFLKNLEKLILKNMMGYKFLTIFKR